METGDVESPALFGYFKPRRLLPEGIRDRLGRQELYHVFLHELGHVKRHDIGVSLVTTVLQVAHWFNPLVWYAFYHLRTDQEAACDAHILSRIGRDRLSDYAHTIVRLLECSCRNRQLPALVGFLENVPQSTRRITMIAGSAKRSGGMTFGAALLLLLLGTVAFTGARETREAEVNEGTSIPALERMDAVRPQRLEQLEVAWGLGFDSWNKQVRVFSDTPGEPEEVIEAEWALAEFEGDRAILTLKDRTLRYGIPDRRDHNATENSSLVSVEFIAGDGVTLNLADGGKVKHSKAFFQVPLLWIRCSPGNAISPVPCGRNTTSDRTELVFI